MRNYLAISVAIVLCACNNYYRARSYETNFHKTDYVTIDSTYVWYIREVYKDTVANAEGKMEQKSGFKDINPMDDKLIETEYLLVSEAKKNVIYFATIPDKWQRYYSRSRKKFGDCVINIYDIRKIFFGKAENDEFEFRYKKRHNADTWIMRRYPDKKLLGLDRIRTDVNDQFDEMLPVSDAVLYSILFRPMETPRFIFNCADKKYDCEVIPKIAIAQEKGKFEVVFHLANPAGNYTYVRFSEDRITYCPEKFGFDERLEVSSKQ